MIVLLLMLFIVTSLVTQIVEANERTRRLELVQAARKEQMYSMESRDRRSDHLSQQRIDKILADHRAEEAKR